MLVARIVRAGLACLFLVASLPDAPCLAAGRSADRPAPRRSVSEAPELPPFPTPEERLELLTGERRAKVQGPPTRREAEALENQELFDVTFYFLDLEFEPVAQQISGSVAMTATSLADGLAQVMLDFDTTLTVSSVTKNAVAQSFTHVGGVLDVTLDEAFDTGQPFQIVVTYGGVRPTNGYIRWYKYFGGTGQMVASLSEPDGARTWWPCKDRPDDKAIVQEWWTVPSTWTATGNGALQGVDTLAGNRTRYRWVPSHPLTTYLVSIAATDYEHFSDTYTPIGGGSMPVNYYVYPELLVAAQTSLNATVPILTYFAQTFGEYPFVEDQYGMSTFPFGGAMEHTANTSYGYNLITGTNYYDWINAHETAHQWFGDSISPETWPDIWLNEGFATYCEALWMESLGGASAYRSYIQGPLWFSSFAGSVYDPDGLFNETVYSKGGLVLHMLRGVMGDGPFFQGMRDWYAAKVDGVGNTAEFQATMEVRYGSSLDWFFLPWVYGEGRPNYQYGFTTANLGGGTFRNYVRIQQTIPSPGLFTMPVQMTLYTASGSEVRTVWNDTVSQDFVLDTTEPLTGLGFDEDYWILRAGAALIALPDGDGDNVPDSSDNCIAAHNPAQENADGDPQGDACDADDDNDALLDFDDCGPLDPEAGTPGPAGPLTATGATGQPTELSWGPAPRADTYDLVRGLVGDLGAGYGACHVTGLPAPTYTDADAPPSGAAYLYLPQGYDAACGGPGPIGVDSEGAPRTSPCP